MIKNIKILVFTIYLFSFMYANTCNTAENYGLINSGTILSGNFSSDGDDYWISFTTTCEFQNILLSTCGSYAENTNDGIEYLDTILEVYKDSETGENACDLFEPWSIDTGVPTGATWWNDDPDDNSDLICSSSDQDLIGEDNHSVLLIPSEEEQNNGIALEPATYYVRISGYPGHSIGEWNLHLTGNATIDLQIDNQDLLLPHNPQDGAPGGFMDVVLDASASTCTEQILNYYWVDDSNNYGPFLNPTETVSMEHGLHQVTLIATDLQGNEYQDNTLISITEPNIGPNANAGDDFETIVPHDGDISSSNVTVSLSGEQSSDGDDDILAYSWNFIGGPDNIIINNSESSNPAFNTSNSFGSDNKEYQFELTTIDPYGLVDLDSVTVTIVSEQNSNPVASAPNLEITILHDGDPETFQSESFVLNASESYDQDGDDLVYYEWQTIISGELQSISNSFIHTVESINYSTIDSVLGEHQYKLIVKDPYEAIDDTTFIVNILPEPNSPPVVQFDPYQVVYFSCVPNEETDCSQVVSLNSYNTSYDPDGDPFTSTWYDDEWNLTSSLQTLNLGTSTFNLIATDSYNESDTLDFSIVISAPNSVPTAITLGTQEVFESTAELDSIDGIDSRFLFGSAVDEDHVDSDLGILWTLLNDDNQISILDSTSLTGEIISGDILNNDYPLILNFLLSVWDPLSCHPRNLYMFNDLNSNGLWDELEPWDPACPIGDDPMTYGLSPLELSIKNYNQAPNVNPLGNNDLQQFLDDTEWVIREDVDTLISFNYTDWANQGLFEDEDDCLFNPDTGCSTTNPYPSDNFNIIINNGENYHTGYICNTNDLYYSTLLECDSLCDDCNPDLDMLVLEENYSNETITVEFQIDDLNEINNLSDTLYIDMFIEPVNDVPLILSFDDEELIQNGVIEDTSFPLFIDDVTFYDVEGDLNLNGECDINECENILISAQESPNYSFSNNTITLTENFFGNLDLGIQLLDFGDTSNVFTVSIPVQGTNDDPNLIFGMDTLDFLDEDFDSTYINLYTIFEDVDGEELVFSLNDNVNDLSIFDYQIIGNDLLLTSLDDINGEFILNFTVLDSNMIEQNYSLDEPITFIVNPVNDSPIAVSEYIETPEDSSLYIPLQGIDIDSDSLVFEIVQFPEHGILGDVFPIDAYNANILYTPETGYRCGDKFEFFVKDLDENGDVLSISNIAEVNINVGDCNFPPQISVQLDINIFEDNTIYFIDSELSNSELPNNFYSLNNQSNFIINDEDSTSLPFVEFWEGENYYIEDGYCASPTLTNDWQVDTTKACGLIPYYAVCDIEFLEQNTNYKDGTKFCACAAGETCTASQYYLDTLAIRPVQDYDTYFDITTIANDGDISYNLSDSSFTRVYLSPINDAPQIGLISNQETNEGEPLHLNFTYSSNLEDEAIENSSFIIYDVDNDNTQISFDLQLNDIFFQTLEQDSLLVINLINPDYNVANTEVMVVLKDQEFLSDTAYFDLAVNQVDDPAIFQSIGVGDNQGEPLKFIEDTGALDFVSEIKIYYYDADWDPQINDNPDEYLYADSVFWDVSPINADQSNIQFYTSEDYPSETGINEDSQLYYSQPIILEYVSPNWNGYDGLYFINDETNDTLLLSVHVTEQNDPPNPFDIGNEPIFNTNVNSYEWSLNEIDLCLNDNLEQGQYDYEINECVISNFYKKYLYSCESTLVTYSTIEECNLNCIESNCIEFFDDMYFRLPYRRVPSNEEVLSDSLLFEWEEAYDIDLDQDFSQDPNNNLNLYYRLELVDNITQKVFVVAESIEENQISVDLSKPFFNYKSELNYYDSCGVFSRELSLSDTSRQFLDLSGSTEYSWRVGANNLWCDELNLDPSYITLGENAKTDFYIDLIPPKGSINILQDQMSPEFMNIYVTFDEPIDEWKSELFITYNSETTSHNFPANNSDNIYGITELFPGLGAIEIDVESWDAVGNGTLSSVSISYNEIIAEAGKSIFSPTETFMMRFDEYDIASDASILIKESNIPDFFDQKPSFQQVSQIYDVSSINMEIIEPLDIAIEIPTNLLDLKFWKFKIFTLNENGELESDITTNADRGVVSAKTNTLSKYALFYNPDAEFEIPQGVELVGNYPNPFNPSTNIFYYIENDFENVSIKILDLLGREVKILYEGQNMSGYYDMIWDGTNINGEQVGSGIYFIQAKLGKSQIYKKVMKLK